MFNIKSNCPVPFEQQPLNEYLILKKSWLFSWSLSSQKDFVLGIFKFVVLFCFLLSFIIYSLIPTYNLFYLIKCSLVFCNFILFFLLLRIYLGWSYILKRLLSATIFYEESGWYDGQVWIKTSDYLIQDRLIGLYQILPFIIRIKYTFLLVIFNFCFFYLINFFE